MDFAMNYNHWHLDQTQGEVTELYLEFWICFYSATCLKHWAHHQTTLLMLVRYSMEADGQVWAKTHCFVSDDGKHSNAFVKKW